MNRLSVVLLVATVGSAGCGGGAEGDAERPPTHPVSGVIKYNGAPVAGAQVTFMPQEANGRGAFGRTDDNGRYTLTTFESDDGAVAGGYYIMISKMEAAAPAAPQISQDDPRYGSEPEPARTEPPKHLLPKKYSAYNTSKLMADVKEGENTFDFDLTD